MIAFGSLTETTAAVLLAVVAALAAASLITFALTRLKPQSDWTELVQRVRSWWVMVAVFAIAVALDRVVSLVFLGFVSFLALKEFLSLIETRRADRRVLFWAYLAIPIQYLWVGIYWYGMFIIFIPVWVFLFLPLVMVRIGDTRGFLRAAGTLNWGLMTTVFSLSHAAYLLSLPQAENPEAGGAGLLLFLVLLTQLNDVCQYLSGKLWGRRKIVPSVSPGKTWEGLFGGLVCTVLVSWLLAPYLTPLEGWLAPAVGGAIAIAGFVGDVVMSAVKRDLGVKDSGGLIPGHGGILDRVDSLTYTAPVFFHIVFYLYY
ncbi:MAG: phosphatidate cytidylyltransferase [Rhodovibrionaceae bacterium]